EGDIQQNPREQRADGRRRLAVRIRKPYMERDQSDLCAESDYYEGESNLEEEEVRPFVGCEKAGPFAARLRTGLKNRIEEEHYPHKSEQDAHRVDDEKLPGRLDRIRSIVKADKENGRKCRGLDSCPHDDYVRCESGGEHRSQEKREQAVVHPELILTHHTLF